VRVLQPQTAQDMRKMLHLVTLNGGTAPRAQTMGYSVGGKTGTAHKQEGKGYAEHKYRSVFVGMAPIDKPRIVVAVMIDEPSGGKLLRRRRRRAGVQRHRAAEPAHAGRAAGHERQAADRGAGRGGVVLMRVLRTPREAADWLRSRVQGGCIATAARSARATASSPGPAPPPTAASSCRRAAAGRDGLPGGAAGSEAYGFDGDAVAAYEGLKAATGPIGALFYGEPTQELDVLAVTGTNGKTSTAWWLAQALSNVPEGACPAASSARWASAGRRTWSTPA
jgi:hypothetical protein